MTLYLVLFDSIFDVYSDDVKCMYECSLLALIHTLYIILHHNYFITSATRYITLVFDVHAFRDQFSFVLAWRRYTDCCIWNVLSLQNSTTVLCISALLSGL